MKKMTLLGLACCALVTATTAQVVTANVNGVTTKLLADDAGTTGLLVTLTQNKDLALGTMSSNGFYYSRLWVKFQSGNVGIGTGGPTDKLHVIGAGRFAGSIKVDGANALELGFAGTKEANAGKICYGCFSPESLNIVGAGTTGANRKVKIWNEGGMETNGALGIGGTPQLRLDVRGDGSAIGLTNSAGWDHLYFKHDGSTAYMRAGGAESGLSLQVGTGGSGGYDNQAYTDVMRLMPNGSVGIGTTAPGAYKLAVEGKIGAREVEVKTSAWADFVFEENYPLPSLQEVEAFITRHKHLPNIPSEAEVLEKGINLGNMDALLLQKIEELTLHLIKQEKRIGALEKENTMLKQLNNQ